MAFQRPRGIGTGSTKTPLTQIPLAPTTNAARVNGGGGGIGAPVRGFFAQLIAQLRGQSQTEVLGPGEPLQSYLTQDPSEGDAPRIIEYPYSSNIQIKPRSEYPDLTPFDQLRALSANYDVVQICHQTLKTEISGLDWYIMPSDPSELKAKDLYKDSAKKVADQLRKPDGDQDLRSWASMLLDEDLQIGAPAIYKHRTRGGKLGPLEIIQGDTIKPIIDYRGKPIAYQQIWRGLPGQVWAKDDFIYSPRIVRRNSVYGKSPVEQVLLTVNTALRKQTYDLAYYTDGNIPDTFMGLDPDKWTVDQIKAFQAYWDDLLSGRDDKRRKVYFYPGDPSKAKDFRTRAESNEQEMWLLYITCAAHNINPEELGFSMRAARTANEVAVASQRRKGVTPIVTWLEGIFTGIIQNDMKHPELCFKYRYNPNEQNVFQQAQADNLYLQNKVYDAAFIRDRDGVRLGNDSPILVEEKYRQEHPELMQPAGITPPNLAGAQNLPGQPGQQPGKPAPIDPNAPGQPKKYPQVGPADRQQRADVQRQQGQGTYTGGPQKHPDGPKYAPNGPKSGDSGSKTAQNEQNPRKMVINAQIERERADLHRWRDKSLDRVKMGKSAACSFTSEDISESLAAHLRTKLALATTPEEVKGVFAEVLATQ